MAFDNIRKLYGITDNEGFDNHDITAWEQALHITLPDVLRSYYLTLGRHEALNFCHNRLLIKDQIGFSDDDYLVFYEENQVVAYWGIKRADLSQPNPPVYGYYEPDWYPENPTTEGFLLLQAVYNGVLGGLKYNANTLSPIPAEVATYIMETRQEQSDISTEIQKVFTNDFKAVVSLSFDAAQQCSGIFIGTHDAELFDDMLDQLDVDWDYISTEDE